MDRLPATGIVLAGGKSQRMGKDKRFLMVGGEPMVARAIAICETLFDDIVIVTAVPETLIKTSHRVVHDIEPDCSALGGIYTGLSYASLHYGFVLACDMPWVSPSVVRFLIERVYEHKAVGYDVVIPRRDFGLEPTHAVYSKRCIPFLKKMIESRDFAIQKLCDVDDLSIRYVSSEEMHTFDPQGRSFVNVNTPSDLERAQQNADFDHSPWRTG